MIDKWTMAKRLVGTKEGVVDWADVYMKYLSLGGDTKFIVLLLPVGRARFITKTGNKFKYELYDGTTGSLTAKEFKTCKKEFKCLKEGLTWQKSM